ncbi:peroxide stress protein YaaA [Porticoccaceae bacterium]|mgnify:FL=1|nr:peroxide stress protein YaaA [Porticoccaceae bacterium]
MLTVISPAKKLDYSTSATGARHSQPGLLDHSSELLKGLKKLSPQDVCGLMGLSDSLGALNYERFQAWSRPFNEGNAKPAILAFKGDVYQGLDAESMTSKQLDWAQDHLRILSGLYGLLRPLDLMQPYRLEMGTKFANERGKDLYQFWGDIITGEINTALAATASPVLLNLASNEYFKSVQQKNIDGRIITPVFMDKKGDKYKIISFYAKKARGLMSAFIIKNKITAVEGIKKFDVDGYVYNEAMSEGDSWVFTRDQ